MAICHLRAFWQVIVGYLISSKYWKICISNRRLWNNEISRSIVNLGGASNLVHCCVFHMSYEYYAVWWWMLHDIKDCVGWRVHSCKCVYISYLLINFLWTMVVLCAWLDGQIFLPHMNACWNSEQILCTLWLS